VTRREGAHDNEVALGDELRIGAFAAPVKAGVELAFAQAERAERGVVDPRRAPDVQ